MRKMLKSLWTRIRPPKRNAEKRLRGEATIVSIQDPPELKDYKVAYAVDYENLELRPE